mmetsp:Transcript_48518/g.144927  ORF Transcript_48518/g.144927 Transcript_48518/m.144927 type:complete len:110 (-) Transcript_48518:651-980(-)
MLGVRMPQAVRGLNADTARALSGVWRPVAEIGREGVLGVKDLAVVPPAEVEGVADRSLSSDRCLAETGPASCRVSKSFSRSRAGGSAGRERLPDGGAVTEELELLSGGQ